jgi:predicted HTH domain antitoxin
MERFETHLRRPRSACAIAALALVLGPMVFGPASALAKTPPSDPSWRPEVSERLVKLPASYLKKSLDRDFAKSGLGLAIEGLDDEIGFKSRTLADLDGAIGKADGAVRTELRHQFLAEKRAYLELVSRKHALRRKHVASKKRVLEGLMRRIRRDNTEMTPVREKLIESQQAARQRFEATVSAVDIKLLATSAAPESRYSREYGKNLTAMETLIRAIDDHPMNAQPVIDGQTVSKGDYIRQLIADTDAEIALIQQEETILGYMAKLIALDATTLSEQVGDAERIDSDVTDRSDVTSAVNFFVGK